MFASLSVLSFFVLAQVPINTVDRFKNLIPEWIQSGSLRNVRQIELGLDSGRRVMAPDEKPRVLGRFLKTWLELYRLRFRYMLRNAPLLYSRTTYFLLSSKLLH